MCRGQARSDGVSRLSRARAWNSQLLSAAGLGRRARSETLPPPAIRDHWGSFEKSLSITSLILHFSLKESQSKLTYKKALLLLKSFCFSLERHACFGRKSPDISCSSSEESSSLPKGAAIKANSAAYLPFDPSCCLALALVVCTSFSLLVESSGFVGYTMDDDTSPYSGRCQSVFDL